LPVRGIPVVASGTYFPRVRHTANGRAKKAASIALRVLAGFVAVAAVFVGVTILVLRSDWGGERLRRQIVARVNAQIDGTLDIERLSFGGDKVQVWGVTLREPDGGIVARVARAEVDFVLLRVLRRELRLTAVTLETPIVSLVSDADGSNLSRATAARTPQKKKPIDRNGREGWVIRLDRFDLTNGDVSAAVVGQDDAAPTPNAHFAHLAVFASARYATGNGATDLTLRVSGQSERAPVGPLRLAARFAAHGDVRRFDADGELLGGTLKARGNLDTRHLEDADILVALAIPRQELAGSAWGPIRIDARAEPTKAPTLDMSIKVPGVELAAKDLGQEEPGVRGRLTVSDLAVTGKAIHALTGSGLRLGGRGEVAFGIERANGAGPAGLEGHAKGAFESLRFDETVVSRMTFDGRAARLSSRPGTASFDLAIASLSAGTTDIHGVALAARLHEQEVSATFETASPARVHLDLAGRFSEDRRVFDLTNLALAFPGERWVSEGVARLRFDEKEVSLSGFRLTSDDQVLAAEGARHGDRLSGHLALTNLRLGQLPTALIDPKMRLEGLLNVDVKAEGRVEEPKIGAVVDLKQAAYQGFSKIDAKLNAKLENDRMDGTVVVDAPFLAAAGTFELPTDLAVGEAIGVKLDIKHADLGQLMRAAERPPLADGRLNLKLRADGSADDPKVTVTMEAFDLKLKPPTAKTLATESVDLGKARVRLTYADRSARAEVDFASAHGGTLKIEASTRVDLSYPRVTRRRIVAAKLPVRGKLVARDLDAEWVAQLVPRLESMGGQVTADARLGGTVGDPQVIGDVRWKNGKVVATPAPPSPR